MTEVYRNKKTGEIVSKNRVFVDTYTTEVTDPNELKLYHAGYIENSDEWQELTEIEVVALRFNK